jgi:hypothetical protein
MLFFCFRRGSEMQPASIGPRYVNYAGSSATFIMGFITRY